jgi:hypothetical protein
LEVVGELATIEEVGGRGAPWPRTWLEGGWLADEGEEGGGRGWRGVREAGTTKRVAQRSVKSWGGRTQTQIFNMLLVMTFYRDGTSTCINLLNYHNFFLIYGYHLKWLPTFIPEAFSFYILLS